MSKEVVQRVINALPDEVEFEKLIELLVLVDKMEKDARQRGAEQIVAQEEIEKIVKSWFN